MKQSSPSKSDYSASLQNLMAVTTVLILVLLPFHAVFTTWLGSNFGHYDFFRIWKELLLVPLTLGSLWLLMQKPEVVRWLKGTRLSILIGSYVGLLLIGAFAAVLGQRVTGSALIYGLLVDLRFLAMFLVCLVLGVHVTWLRARWKPVLFWPAAVVVGFGLLQLFILPADFLRHLGYGSSTIPAFQLVDQKADYVRLQSTLRGPNPLGAYLVIVFAGCVLMVLKNRRRLWWIGASLVTGVVLFYTYSRSALLGAVVAAGLVKKWNLKFLTNKRLLIIVTLVVLVAGVGSLALRQNDRFQNTFFHTDENSTSPDSSNSDRADAIKTGLNDIRRAPWGSGPGTAGPASVRNRGQARIAENYYLQIGQEAGVLGLVLFLSINLMIGLVLWRVHDELSLVLLASLMGITLINLLSHAWADDTLSLIWWGLAGLAVVPDILRRSNHEQ